MNEEMVLKLAKETTLDLWPGWVYEGRSLENLIAFANACCEYQRENDAGICERFGNDGYGYLPAAAIRANKGE